MPEFILVTIKAAIRCVYLTYFLCFTLFQIRAEPKSCLTLHHVYGSQGANRTAKINIQTCIDRTHSPKAAVYQVGNNMRIMHVWQTKKKAIYPSIFACWSVSIFFAWVRVKQDDDYWVKVIVCAWEEVEKNIEIIICTRWLDLQLLFFSKFFVHSASGFIISQNISSLWRYTIKKISNHRLFLWCFLYCWNLLKAFDIFLGFFFSSRHLSNKNTL
jgi:hypothetical protein